MRRNNQTRTASFCVFVVAQVLLIATSGLARIASAQEIDGAASTKKTAALSGPPADSANSNLKLAPAGDHAYETLSLRGRVVWMAEALERRFGIRSVREAKEHLLALECFDGTLHPLVEDSRGRAFRLDPRLRGVDMELLVRRYAGSPMVRVIRVYALTGKAGSNNRGREELDYWCEICAIAMFELKPCDCCQGPIELRRRPVSAEASKTIPNASQ